MTDYVNKQLGNYRLVRHLGRGGFADVYLGIHVHLKTQAAIKLLHTQLSGSEIEQFRTEARTIARLEHPHIVRVLDFGIQDHTPFLVMSYAPNGTLRQKHPKGTQLPLSAVISYVKQVADALQYAHERKLIHRDIKPENMLVGRFNEVLLSDFGFVLIAQSSMSQSTKEMAGTVPYMAPEQFQGRPRSASDQYALGIVVYEWLAGDRPFQGSVLEIATQHMLTPPPSLCAKNPAIPPVVEEVVFTALAKDPLQRFATVKAFANALEQASKPARSIASTATIALAEPEIQHIDTQVLPAVAPAELSQNAASTFQTQSYEPSFSSLAQPDQLSESLKATLMDESALTRIDTDRQPRLPRRTVLAGLAGVAVGSVASSGIWLAKAAGMLGGNGKLPPAGPPPPTPIVPAPGTTFLVYTGHTDAIYQAAWSPDGYRIASASADNTVQVWDAATGGKVLTYRGHQDLVLAVAWSPDGKYIASGGANYTAGGDKTVQVWEAATGNLIFTFKDHTDAVRSLAWSPGGQRIASASYDESVRVWDAFTGQNALMYKDHTNWVQAVAWSPDGKYIASAGQDKRVRVWDALTGQNVLPPLTHMDWVQSVAWSPDSQYLASADGDNGSNGNREHLVRIWEVASGKSVYTYRGHTDEVQTVAWSPNGKRLASASADGEHTVHIWDAFTGGHVLIYRGHTRKIWSVAWAPEGSRIASASKDKLVLVWKAV